MARASLRRPDLCQTASTKLKGGRWNHEEIGGVRLYQSELGDVAEGLNKQKELRRCQKEVMDVRGRQWRLEGGSRGRSEAVMVLICGFLVHERRK